MHNYLMKTENFSLLKAVGDAFLHCHGKLECRMLL